MRGRSASRQECEVKIEVPRRAALVSRLRALGAQDHGDHLERNRLFDTRDGALQARGCMLRLREYQGALLTYKGPVTSTGPMKRREEIECGVDSAADAARLLTSLGYVQTWAYEKRRHSWAYRECQVALDLVPELGSFIEVEGDSEAQINEVLRDLELDREAAVTESYHGLHVKHRTARGQPVGDMRFAR